MFVIHLTEDYLRYPIQHMAQFCKQDPPETLKRISIISLMNGFYTAFYTACMTD